MIASWDIMGPIYCHATTTHAWLGLDSARLDGQFCLSWNEAIVESMNVSRTKTELEFITIYWRDVIGGIIHRQDEASVLLKILFDREYFKRRWTIQER